MKSFLVLTSLLVGATLATKFEKCSTFGGPELCFKTTLKEAIVTVDKDGTNDDVFMEICSDRDASQCCKSKALKSLLSDDWSSNDQETWSLSYFDSCKKVVFKIERGLRVTLSKTSKSTDDPLKVKSIQIDTKSPDKKDKEEERFICPSYTLNKSKGSQTNFCKAGPYHFGRINNAVVTMGKSKTDGTDDNVKIKICSDVNSGPSSCCEKKLSRTLRDDWQKGKTETWATNQFGDCAKKLYKIRNNPIVSITKDGKDDLKVEKFVISFNEIDIPPKKHTYSCNGFHLSGTCTNAAACTVTLSNCQKKTTNAASTNNRTTKKPKRTTKRPAAIRTTTRSSAGIVTTMPTKKSFLGSLFGR